MTDCDHDYLLESIESPTGSEGTLTRIATLKCKLCEHVQQVLTQRTDKQIAAETA